MTEKSITESGMIFGPYPEEKCFHIEESKTYHQLRSHIKIAEFLLIRNLKDCSPIVWVVEAKSSSPQPCKNIIFDEFIEEIRDKMVSTFNLSMAILLQRHKLEYAALPDPYRELDLSKTGFRFILVIKGHLVPGFHQSKTLYKNHFVLLLKLGIYLQLLWQLSMTQKQWK